LGPHYDTADCTGSKGVAFSYGHGDNVYRIRTLVWMNDAEITLH